MRILEDIREITPLYAACITHDRRADLTQIHIHSKEENFTLDLTGGSRGLLLTEEHKGALVHEGYANRITEEHKKSFAYTNNNIIGWTSLHWEALQHQTSLNEFTEFTQEILRKRLPPDFYQNIGVPRRNDNYISLPLGPPSTDKHDIASNTVPRQRTRVFYDKGIRSWTWGILAANGRDLRRTYEAQATKYASKEEAMNASLEEALSQDLLPQDDVIATYLLGITIYWMYEGEPVTRINFHLSDGTHVNIYHEPERKFKNGTKRRQITLPEANKIIHNKSLSTVMAQTCADLPTAQRPSEKTI